MSLLRPRAAVLSLALATALGGAFMPSAGWAAPKATVDIPFEEFTLPNGLRVVVHTDRKAPIVAVNIWYHVGSKDEPAGRTGFAHLFEHLMFNGSENHKGEFFEPFELVGATDQNGTTNTDRTNYFQNVPTTALDMALWMESDRMGHLLGAIDQKTLDEQRGVVQNEKRQGENQPYGQVWDELGKAMYPKTHPYHHSTIGSMADLNAASLDDVKGWFRTWYGPNNAVLVLAGDIDVATAKDKVARYFGDIPATPTMAQPKVDVAPLAKSTRATMTDQVPQARIYRVWNVPQTGTTDLDELQLFAQVLGGSRSSRLDRRLLHEDKLVDNVSAAAYGMQLGSNFIITADVKQGVDPAKVEAVIDEELRKLLKDGPSKAELEQARTVFKAGFVRGIERIGGFGGKADALAECAVYTGDPGCFRDSLKTIETASAADIKAVGNEWLGKGSHTLVVVPGRAHRDCRRSLGDAGAADAAGGRSQVHDHRQHRRPQQGRAADPDLPRSQVPGAAARDAEERHAGDPRRAPRHSGRADELRVQGRLQRRPGPQARHLELRDGHDRRGRGRVGRAGLRRPRRVAGRQPRRRRLARWRQGLPVGAEGKPRCRRSNCSRRCCARRASTRRRSTASRRPGSRASSRRRRARTAPRCACCRRCCTATAMPMPCRSAAAAPRRRSAR